MRVRIVLPLALASIAVLAGCGGGGDGGGGELSKEGYIEAADSICAEAGQKINELGTPQSIDELVAYAPKARAIAEEQLADLRALDPPDEIQAQVDEALGLQEQGLTVLDQLVEAAQSADLAKVQELGTQIQDITDRSSQLAADIGLKECGG